MHVALLQEHNPFSTNEILSRSDTRGGTMDTPSPWDDPSEESQLKTDGSTTSTPQPVSISTGFAPMNQGTMLTGTAEMPTGQYIYLQPPSSAAKVMGIILILAGLLQSLGLFSLFIDPVDPITGEVLDYPAAAKLLDGLSSLLGMVGFILAGVFLTRYEKRGVWLGIGTLVAQFVLGVASFASGTPDGGLAALVGDEGTAFAIWAGVSAFCNGICALLVAIPLMVSNNGLE